MPGYNDKKRNEAFMDYHDKREALNGKFLKPTVLTQEDYDLIPDNSSFKVGKEYVSNLKIPTEPEAAFKLFVDYYATLNLYTQQNLFFDTYLTFENKTAIKEEIAAIEAFINEADKVSYKEACTERYNIDDFTEYKRFSEGFYNLHLMSEEKFNEGSVAARVYGKYVLFYEYLKNQLDELASPNPTNLISKLKDISFEYDMDFYTNKENIRNQNLVIETVKYFECGAGSRAFKPLDFLNLLKKQQAYVNFNYVTPLAVIEHLKGLLLSPLEKHILYGLIIKWTGGYPVNNLDEQYNQTMKAIQKEFLAYPESTPEKIFCKANEAQRDRFDILGIAFTTSINSNIDVEEVLAGMGYMDQGEKIFYNFNALFDNAVKTGMINSFENKNALIIAQSDHHHKYKKWLKKFKGLEYGDEDAFEAFLKMDLFAEFLKYQNELSLVEPTPYEQVNFSTTDSNYDVNDLNGTIDELTEGNLKKHGFDEEDIKHFFDPNYPNHEHRNNDIVLASKIDGKIYSGFKGARKFYFRENNIQFPYKFPKLIDEYYSLMLAKHLHKKETLLGSNYHQISETEIFINKQISWVNKEIEAHHALIKTYKFSWHNIFIRNLENQIEILESYLGLLNRKIITYNKLPENFIVPLIPTPLADIPNSIVAENTVNILPSKTELLKIEFKQYGFLNLEKVKVLSPDRVDELIGKISESDLPYKIAMMDYLGFMNYLLKAHFSTFKKLELKISNWFKSDTDGRAVRGNRLALVKPCKRYTAHLHKQSVERDYQELK
ncbi:hypothetical protein QN352_02380 [Mucilaginibacter sp. 10I4]|nr:hypothetical protein [Mucilaginibacter sp. 10I4]